MPRPLSQSFLLNLYGTDTDELGILFAKQCVQAKLPSAYVAKAIGVSRLTIHNWFRGKRMRDKYIPIVQAFMKLVSEDTEKGLLPVKDAYGARLYIDNMIGVETETTTNSIS
jgi:hypothetical protein